MTDSDLFELDQRLAATSIAVTRRAGIEVRLVNDSRYQWLMLVPCLPDIFEMDDLPPDVAADLFRLAGDLGSWLKSFAAADKINIAMIGNVVPQMHVHVVARHRMMPTGLTRYGDAAHHSRCPMKHARRV